MSRILFLTAEASRRMREEIARARGNEVCFICEVGDAGDVREPRVVARGHGHAVPAAVAGAAAGMLVVHNHPSGVLDPSDADLAVAAALHERGVGLAITDNSARELYVVVEPVRPRELERLDEAAIEEALAPAGALARWHPGYEDRPTQREMAVLVARTYNEGGIALAEAGTGTGKSVAYLLPAIRWAALNHERTIISTNTINLQEQLVGKDLPLLRRALGEPFRFALVKGRRNYISIRRARLAAAAESSLFSDAERVELSAILDWLKETKDGSLQDLPFTPSPEVWDEVASESDVCLRAKCPHFEACFYQRARRDAATADVLVVNHHLLFSDLAVRRAQDNYTAPAVLPPYRRVILDEAHNLEDAATAHLGASVSRRGLERLLARLDRRGRGVLHAVEARLLEGPADLLQQDALDRISGQLRPAVEQARRRAADLFGRLEARVARTEEGMLRLGDGAEVDDEGSGEALESLTVVLTELAAGLQALSERIALDTGWRAAMEEQLLELEALAERIRAVVDGLRLALLPGRDPDPLVRWLERRGGGQGREPNVLACAAPVDLSDALREALFERVDTAILTSATLATCDGFEFLRSRLGLRGGLRVQEATFASPFDYSTQAQIMIPTDLPEPRGEAHAGFDFATAEVVEDVVEASDGGVFVLFTSYRSLRVVAAELRRRGLDARWPLFVQGEGPRSRLVQSFTASGRGVLLGVSSFWEGVDVPGEPLRALVLTKLPFKVPSEPLTAARIEAIEREGGNAFYEYMLPQAALRLKQGFGRLIRSRTDRGVVVLLDRRVVTRGYGRYLLESLPPAPVRVAAWADLVEEIRAFYRREGGGSGAAGGRG
ncbi:MAG TPA: helicase C-terminal domain-containing protein [Longimicrobiales bacterium]